MKRLASGMVGLAVLAAAALGEARGGPYMSHVWTSNSPMDGAHWGAYTLPSVPGYVGAWGQPVPVAAPYNVNPPTGADAARAMLSRSVPLEFVQAAGLNQPGMGGSGILQAQAVCPPGGCPGGIAPPGAPGLPGVPGPGYGIPGAVAAVGALTGPGASPFPVQRTEVRFVGPAGMKISWYAPTPDGRAGFGPQYLEAPARYNFLQASIYRLKLSDIPNRPGVELYPTLEVVPAKAKTATFLAHSAVPVVFTEEDFEQVAAGNFVVKVIYLPDPQFQDLAATGPDEVVSSRLEPGVDPICEAQRRGSILLVVRLGNIDLEAPNTPAMDTPNPFHARAPQMPQMPMQGLPPGVPPGLASRMVPYGAMGQQPPPGMPGMPGMPGLPPGPQMPYPAMPQGQLPPGMGMPAAPVPGGMPLPPAGAPGVAPGPQSKSSSFPTMAELAGRMTNWGPSDKAK
jgi:hypothetical protein